MTPDEFVRVVAAARPSRERLLEYGIDDAGIENIYASFTCRPIAGAAPSGAGADPLLSLITQYDCSSLEVSQIRFVRKPAVHAAGVVVGYWEADPLVVTSSGEVVVFD